MEDIELLSPGQRLKKIRKILNVNQEELAGKKLIRWKINRINYIYFPFIIFKHGNIIFRKFLSR